MKSLAIALGLTVAAGCASSPAHEIVPLGSARAVSDFASYDLRRVGVLPPTGNDLDAELARSIAESLATSFAADTAYEIVPLGAVEMESVGALDPSRTGRVQAPAILELARRSGVDALLAARVVDLRPYEPIRFGLEVDLVAVETGLVVWTAQVRVDTADRRTLEAVEAWQWTTRTGGESERAVDLLSPRRMGEFAAAQASMLL